MSLRIGEMAAQAGCPVVTVRFYEKEGLLNPPERTASNYRVYSQKDLERLRFILHCRKHGIKLEEIRQLLVFKDNPQKECGYVHALIKKHLAHVETQIESLNALKAELEEMSKTADCCQNGHCSILERLSDIGDCRYCRQFPGRKAERAL